MTVKKYPVIKIAISVIVIILVIFLFNYPKTSSYFRGIFYRVFSPIQKTATSFRVKIINIGNAIANFNNLRANNEQLTKENQTLLADIMRLKELSAENDVLRRALDLKINENYKLIQADAIGRDFNKETIVIDAGTGDGVEKGMPVITAEKMLVGKIDTVFEGQSIVNVITSKNCAFDVKIADKDISGIAKGEDGGYLLMDLVPRDKDVEEGDIVLTAKEGGIYPDGVIVGRVSSVKNNSLETFLAVIIEPAISVDLIKDIFVIKDY